MAGFVHPSAVVAGGAVVHSTAEIGPFCTVGPHVVLGEGTRLISHVVVEGRTTLGARNTVYPFAVVGMDSPDLKYKGEPATLVVGDDNVIREYVTLHIGTAAGSNTTVVGDGNLIMAGAHIAHDCVVGNRCIIANFSQLAGHVTLEDEVVVGGLTGIHQRVRVGKGAIIGGHSAVDYDVPPYANVSGKRADLKGLNLIGLRRRGMERGTITALQDAFDALFMEPGDETLHARAERVKAAAEAPEVLAVVEFVLASERGMMGAADD